jgi:tol-pal system protein YbgF
MSVLRPRPNPSRTAIVLLSAAIPWFALGCAHTPIETTEPPSAAAEQELAQLRRENAALRGEIDNLEERLRQRERTGGDGWGSGEPAEGYQRYGSVGAGPANPDEWASADPGDGPRKLPVVKLTPSGRSIEHRDPSPSPAPSSAQTSGKRGRGSIALSSVPHSGAPDGYAGDYVVDSDDDDDYAELASEPSGAPASYRLVGSKLVQATQRKPVGATGRDKDSGVVKDYKAAMVLYQAGRYADAEQAFAGIVSAHPNHEYADNALYWQGEAAYDQAHYADALAAFTKVVERYGGGNKAPDALLKIGLCYGRLGDTDNARDVLTQLIAAYPSANASKIAKRKLDDLD